jgi:hypothetical protein
MSELTRDELEQRAAELGVPDPAGLPNKEALEAAIEAMTPNPALAPPLPPAPGPVVYEVVGPRTVNGCTRGQRFTATMSSELESSLVEAGHIIRIEKE